MYTDRPRLTMFCHGKFTRRYGVYRHLFVAALRRGCGHYVFILWFPLSFIVLA